MCQLETALCLSLELIKRRTVLNYKAGKKFQRDITLQFFVACKPDNAHPAAAEDLDESVAAKKLLSAGELTRRRLRDAAPALVNHVGKIATRKLETKIKAQTAAHHMALFG